MKKLVSLYARVLRARPDTTAGKEGKQSMDGTNVSTRSKKNPTIFPIPLLSLFSFASPPFSSSSLRLISSQFTFTMGSLANGSQPGTFLFTSESVGEGHPDKIA